MLKCFIIITVLFSINISYADEDYSTVKGDWKIIKLGDTKDVVYAKLKYLEDKKEIEIHRGYKEIEISYISSVMFEYDYIDVSFEFFENKLYKITIEFRNYLADEAENAIKPFILNKIKPMFTKLYGKPYQSYGFPDILSIDSGYINYTDKWIIKQNNLSKEIIIGVSNSSYKYFVRIYIIDSELNKQYLKDQEAKSKSNVDKTSKDF
jgi:hypothetical protein